MKVEKIDVLSFLLTDLERLDPVRVMIEAFGTGDEERLKNVTFSILEIMDINSDACEINRRESHWKRILLSRSVGHNRN
ncbi:hypothetical protein OGX56_04345 [Citrobacter sp. Cf094]|uniref:hypothetical protein n=1 Tax=Citrobacter sp. Cf094 TaxID=2985057 RepID=UPI0025773C15|nr:hypothetical protein [Citrobacter sp. Cf094]MDM3191526.1 hypothetical protein [Citrobacter sp. Cf094]